ncbi:hypothetical protein EU805_08820 [Salipiger sp. IMCC34102]|uniref:hypothetical protein n=1 Tax=Salipiger sp. IMCC34102 TaxID=2510647 RepID=UPI00101B6B15|nr:hypothetical protein [Salipiger sp. IMCC34102]RYH02709.1 hypothetical protein EU805_08820 [Salipiger sp. IMCC34102]
MSAPKTNLDKQKSRHRGAMTGIITVVVFALILLAGLIFFISANGNTPEGAETQIEGTTGAEVPADGDEDGAVD